jgi:hypothetical protein
LPESHFKINNLEMRLRKPDLSNAIPITTTAAPFEDLPVANYFFVNGVDSQLDAALARVYDQAAIGGAHVVVGVNIQIFESNGYAHVYGTAVVFADDAVDEHT